jgi:hypothetical protein
VVYFKEFLLEDKKIPEVPCISGPLLLLPPVPHTRPEAQTQTLNVSSTVTDISLQGLIFAYVFVLTGFFVFAGIFLQLERWRHKKEKTA